MDLNTIVLGKTSVSKRKDIVNNASESDLLRVTEDTIKKMVRRKGSEGYYKDRKTIYFGNVSNGWNAWAKSVELYKSKLFINFYIQYSNTDTEDCEYWNKFSGTGEFRGTIKYTDRYGNGQTSYYRFDRANKAKVVRAILLAYLERCEK